MPEGTARLLAQAPSFGVLGGTEPGAVAARAVARSCPAGGAIFREGEASNTCDGVRSGHARATRQHPDGRQIVLATFGPGDIFGELAMFDDELRSATVEATDELEVLA